MPTPFDETSGFTAANKTLVPNVTTAFNFNVMGNPERQAINDIAPFANIHLDHQAGVWG